MKTKKPYNNIRIVAMILLGMVLLSVACDWIAFYVLHTQEISPLIPVSTTQQLAQAVKIMAIVLSSVALPALILFFCRKDRWVVVLCGAAMVFESFYAS
ncbi:hypothetical protein Q4E93_19385 [Flavitalea sp. BT771]|uniref:hypothetical protein n=1 Tax=Flavitalea sp. BT771 TaxID=3063329 RepID=UPI0026E11D30|nr:hypothetical protein [Flavitalea sp. BT771]MDO6432779.1 hypothetical protein [Flavitalea sp. BT771]MDV6221945.1 hypothetical protein [Flavitalea sp. BT771]